jgi:Tol biopolymer transport system component
VETKMKKNKSVLIVLAVVFALVPLIPVRVAQAQATTTQYLNGRIAFDSNQSSTFQVYLINPDGSQKTNLINNSTDSYGQSWSRDGTKAVFTTNRDGNFEIYTMDADGTNLIRLTNNTAYEDYPTWSPDGTQIAFESGRDGFYGIWAMNADGTNQHKLTDNTYNYGPSWSPDGTKIIFTSGRDPTNQIYSMNSDGSNVTRLSSNSFYDGYPGWSPDGTNIVFSSSRDGNPEIYTMNADGSGQTRLTNDSAQDTLPDWSPDGTKIVFTSNRDGNKDIYSMNTDGTNVFNITNDTFNNENYSSESWQPLPYTQTTNNDGTTTSTITASNNYTATDYTVVANETLSLDGSLCDVIVQSGGTLMGTGHACTITVQTGGVIAPGHSPGCITSGNLSLAGTYTAQLGGTTACTGYDQLQVTGSVTVGGTLASSLVNGFVPVAGNSFTVIDNDGADAVIGTFAGLAQGSSFTVSGVTYQISYNGGTGNDVVLTVTAVTTEATAITPVPGAPNTGRGFQMVRPEISLITTIVLTGSMLYFVRRLKSSGLDK